MPCDTRQVANPRLGVRVRLHVPDRLSQPEEQAGKVGSGASSSPATMTSEGERRRGGARGARRLLLRLRDFDFSTSNSMTDTTTGRAPEKGAGFGGLLRRGGRFFMRAFHRLIRGGRARRNEPEAPSIEGTAERSTIRIVPGITLELRADEPEASLDRQFVRDLFKRIRRTPVGAELTREFDPASPWNRRPLRGTSDCDATLIVRILENASKVVSVDLADADGLSVLELARPMQGPQRVGSLVVHGIQVEGHPDQPKRESWQLDALVVGALCEIYLHRVGVLAQLSEADCSRLTIGLGAGASWYYTENRYRAQAHQPLRLRDRNAGVKKEDAKPRPASALSTVLQAAGRSDVALAAPWKPHTTRWG